MSLTNFGAKETLDALFDVHGATLYVALFTAIPGDDGTGGTEVSGGSYAREATTVADWAAATLANPSLRTTSAGIQFTQATAAWGTVTSFGLYDAISGGNLVWAGMLTTPRLISTDDTANFGIGALSLTLT